MTKTQEECMAALERLGSLQARAVENMRICSLGRVQRVRKEYLGRLSACAARGDSSTLARLGRIYSAERGVIQAAQAKLRTICGTLNTLQNRTRLSKSYQA